MGEYYVYILASISRVLYIGVTNNLKKRVWEHENGFAKNSFTHRYNIYKLVYYEQTRDVHSAINREKQLKKWRREKKLKIIKTMNLNLYDLYEQI